MGIIDVITNVGIAYISKYFKHSAKPLAGKETSA